MESQERSRSRLIKALIAIGVIIVVFALAANRRKGPDAMAANAAATPPAPPVPVTTEVVSTHSINRTISIVGQLLTDRRVSLTSKVAGKLSRLLVTTGTRVAAGQLVAELDSSDFMVQLRQAQAALQGAQAAVNTAEVRLAQAHSGQGLKDVQTSAGLAEARANLAAARSKLAWTEKNAAVENSQLDIAVRQAASQLASAQQNLSQVREGSRKQERLQAQASVARAQADFDHASNNFQKIDSLYKQGAVSQQARDDASYALDTARAALESAKQGASLVEEGSRSQQIAVAEQAVQQARGTYDLAVAQRNQRSRGMDEILQAREQVAQLAEAVRIAQAGTAQYTMSRQDIQALRAQLMQARAQANQMAAQVELARQNLENTRILSPVDGVVDTRPATEGSSIMPTTVLMTITPTQGLYFEGQVPEDQIGSVRTGDPVITTVDAIPGQAFRGHVSEVIPVAESSSRSYRVKVSLPNSGGVLPENGFARGVITVGRVEGLVVPKSAIGTLVGDTFVYIVENGKAVRKSVTLGYTDDTQALLATGVKPGDRVVVAGIEALSNGARVTEKPDPTAALGTAEVNETSSAATGPAAPQ